MSRNARIALTVIVAVGCVAFLLVTSAQTDISVYKHVNEIHDEGLDTFIGKNMQVHGIVEPGSLEKKIVDQQSKQTFVLEMNGKRIHVRHTGPTPDTFKETAEVIAKGQIVNENGHYVVEADELTAKCPSKYEENNRTKNIGQPAAL